MRTKAKAQIKSLSPTIKPIRDIVAQKAGAVHQAPKFWLVKNTKSATKSLPFLGNTSGQVAIIYNNFVCFCSQTQKCT